MEPGREERPHAGSCDCVEHADVAVMCLGLDATIEGEQGDAGNEYASGDKLGLNLPGLQEELLETVAAMGKPVVVLLMAGSAIDLSWAEHNPNVKAIVDCWYPGAEVVSNCRNAVWRIFPLRETTGEILSWNRKSSGVEY